MAPGAQATGQHRGDPAAPLATKAPDGHEYRLRLALGPRGAPYLPPADAVSVQHDGAAQGLARCTTPAAAARPHLLG